MKKFLKVIAICMAVVAMCSGCEQVITKNYGGEMTMELEPNQKLEMVTWKDNSLWYLTRTMGADEYPETYQFRESSNFGVFEGTVTIVESRQ